MLKLTLKDPENELFIRCSISVGGAPNRKIYFKEILLMREFGRGCVDAYAVDLNNPLQLVQNGNPVGQVQYYTTPKRAHEFFNKLKSYGLFGEFKIVCKITQNK